MMTAAAESPFRTVFWISTGVLAALLSLRVALKLQVNRLHRQAEQVLKLVSHRSTSRIEDAEGMLPVDLRRTYQIEAELQIDRQSAKTEYTKILTSIKEGNKKDPREILGSVSDSTLDATFDYCWSGDAEREAVEEWLVSRDDVRQDQASSFFPKVRRNYFELARESERTGEIKLALQNFGRFQRLTRLMEENSGVAEQTDAEVELTFAEVRRRVLSPRNFLRWKALDDIDIGDAQLQFPEEQVASSNQ